MKVSKKTRKKSPIEKLSEKDLQLIWKRYKRHSGAICPICGSADIEGSGVNVDGGIATQEVVCTECNSMWEDIYTLRGIAIQDITLEALKEVAASLLKSKR